MKLADEQAYVKAVAGGDEHAFTFLFLRYFPKVKRFIANLLQSEDEAEDLSQDIFVRIWVNRTSLVEIENLNAYLYCAAKNAVYQHIRRVLLLREYGEKQQNAFYQDGSLGEQHIEEDIYADELALLVEITVERMPPQRKKIYEMSRKESKSNDDIANLLSISKRTVENHLTQALSDIRKSIRFSFLFI